MQKPKKYTLEEISNIGWSHGFVFGKYTKQTILDNDLQAMLDNDLQAINIYMQQFNIGFKFGLAETTRLSHDEYINYD
nr:MAG TPA: hypothetical protein [Inoviridae sp.]